MDIAGPGAKLLIDSFEGRDLPPKALIKSIRVTRDQFAPEVHFAGEVRIEILTQPGIGPIRGTMRSGFYDSATDGRNPLVNQTGPAQSWQYGIGLNGTLINERASFSFNFNGQDSYSTPVAYAATPFGQVAGNIPLRSPADNYFFNGGVDYALDARSGPAREFPGLAIQPRQRRHRLLRSAGTRLHRRRQPVRPVHSAERADRPAVRAEYPAVGVWQRLGVAVSRRSAHHHRQRRVHERRSAAARRHARAELLDELGSRLRARHPLDARRHRDPGRHASTPMRTATISAPTSSRASRRSTRARRAASAAGSAMRGFATTTSRAASTSRTTSRFARA